MEIKHQNTKDRKKYAVSLCEKYGLKDCLKKQPSELSGGMRQRVAFIRTLALKPKLLLLDEPFSALDYQTRLSVQDDVFNIIKSEQKTAILVTHDINEAISLADRIIILSKRPAKVVKEYKLDFKDLYTMRVVMKRAVHFDTLAAYNEAVTSLEGK